MDRLHNAFQIRIGQTEAGSIEVPAAWLNAVVDFVTDEAC